MAFEVVPTATGRLHSDQYTKIIIINTPINLSLSAAAVQATSSRLQVLQDEKEMNDLIALNGGTWTVD